MPDGSDAAPAIAGLAVGIAFVVSFALLFGNVVHLYPKPGLYEYPSSLLVATKELDEVKAFLAHYPAAKTNAYSSTRIVEYFTYDGVSGKYADLKIQIDLDNHISLMQVRCLTADIATSSVIDEGITLLGRDGGRISGISDFLQDDHCPK